MQKLWMAWEVFIFFLQGCSIGMFSTMLFVTLGLCESFIFKTRLRDTSNGRITIAYMAALVATIVALMVAAVASVFLDVDMTMDTLLFLQKTLGPLVYMSNILFSITISTLVTVLLPLEKRKKP